MILRNYPNNNIRKLLCPYGHSKLKKINYTYYNRLRELITSKDFKCIFYLSTKNNEIIELDVVTHHQAQVLNLFDNIKNDLKSIKKGTWYVTKLEYGYLVFPKLNMPFNNNQCFYFECNSFYDSLIF
jgi:hypothetical protein